MCEAKVGCCGEAPKDPKRDLWYDISIARNSIKQIELELENMSMTGNEDTKLLNELINNLKNKVNDINEL